MAAFVKKSLLALLATTVLTTDDNGVVQSRSERIQAERPPSISLNHSELRKRQDPAAGTDNGPFVALGNNPPYQAAQWVGLGDSFASGPGAGRKTDSACIRGENAYPALLSLEKALPPNSSGSLPAFVFKACAGDTISMMIDSNNPNFQQAAVGVNTEFVTLSIGANDVDLANVVQACIYAFSSSTTCQTAIDSFRNTLYSANFFNDYMTLLSDILNRMNWKNRPRKRTAIYITGYPQFFDVNPGYKPDQCDGISLRPSWTGDGPKITKTLRIALNELTHELNYILQLYVDIMNAHSNDPGSSVDNMFTNAVDFVDVDMLYTHHRFCRYGQGNNPVVEPALADTSVWFYHLGAPERALTGYSTDPNDADILAMAQKLGTFLDIGTTPGSSIATVPNWITRAFHPTPEGMQATVQHLLNMKLNFPSAAQKTLGAVINVMVVGDDICYGVEDPNSDEYQGFMSHLDAIFRDHRYYGYSTIPQSFNPPRLQFIGSNRHPNNPFRSHECYEQFSINEITAKVMASPVLKQPQKVVVVMAGSIDFFAEHEIDTAIQRLQNLINIVIQFGDQNDVILVSQIPQFGPFESFPAMSARQQAIAVYNARISGLVDQLQAENRRVIKVHTSATPADFMDNAMTPNMKGYARIAYDIAEAIVQAQQTYGMGSSLAAKRGVPYSTTANSNTSDKASQGWRPLLKARDPIPAANPSCSQPRNSQDAIINAAPSGDNIMTSILRGYTDEDQFIRQVACNATVICKTSPDGIHGTPEQPFATSLNATTCLWAGGSSNGSDYNQLMIVMPYPGYSLVDSQYCQTGIKGIFDGCIRNNNNPFYGGTFNASDGLYIQMSNQNYPNSPLLTAVGERQIPPPILTSVIIGGATPTIVDPNFLAAVTTIPFTVGY